MSGQGPYFGQGAWFTKFHPEKLPSAQERYLNEIKRVVGVLDKHLQGREYLVGDKWQVLPWKKTVRLG
jgi:glutathione S-transferase